MGFERVTSAFAFTRAGRNSSNFARTAAPQHAERVFSLRRRVLIAVEVREVHVRTDLSKILGLAEAAEKGWRLELLAALGPVRLKAIPVSLR